MAAQRVVKSEEIRAVPRADQSVAASVVDWAEMSGHERAAEWGDQTAA
jgi:hypothetical protein